MPIGYDCKKKTGVGDHAAPAGSKECSIMHFTHEISGVSTFLTAYLPKAGGMSEFTHHILSSFEIPHVCRALRRTAENENGTVLRYDITGCRSLAELLDERRLTFAGLARLVIAAAETLAGIGEYMLAGDGFLFDADYIFYTPQKRGPSFVYSPAFPSAGGDGLGNLRGFLLTLTSDASLFAESTKSTPELAALNAGFLSALRAKAADSSSGPAALARECQLYLSGRASNGAEPVEILPEPVMNNTKTDASHIADRLFFPFELCLLLLLLCVPFAGLALKWNDAVVFSVLLGSVFLFAGIDYLFFHSILRPERADVRQAHTVAVSPAQTNEPPRSSGENDTKAAPSRAYLEWQCEGELKRIPLAQTSTVVIGRERDHCDIVINHEQVDAVHAEFVYRDGGYYLIDLGSKCGTYIGNRQNRLTRDAQCRIFDGDLIFLGSLSFCLREHRMAIQAEFAPAE